MTYQVGIVGTDGILLASDRLESYVISATELNPYAPTQPGEVSKFFVSENGFICAFAGTPTSRTLAREIARNSDLDENLSGLAFERRIEEMAGTLEPPRGMRDEIIIARVSDLSSILVVSRWPQSLRFTQRCNWITTGDNSHPSRFVLEHFYEKRPIAELERLALLTLYYATIENPSTIAGMEICRIDSHGISGPIVCSARIDEFREDARQIEVAVKKSLY